MSQPSGWEHSSLRSYQADNPDPRQSIIRALTRSHFDVLIIEHNDDILYYLTISPSPSLSLSLY